MQEGVTGLVLLSGVPAAGKSTYGRWLAQAKDVLHVDIENGDLERHGLAGAWAMSTSSVTGSPEPLVRAMRGLDRPVALDWGYPLVWLPFVMALHSAGVAAWWFDGDRAAARLRFIQRGTVPVQALDVQMQQIAAAETALRDFYVNRWLDVIRADGTYRSWGEIHDLMFQPSP